MNKLKKDTVSILVPVYNVEKYLPALFDSIEKQKYDKYEVIFVNDGSTDNSLKLLNNFCKKNKNCKVVSQKNKGLPGARNTALKHANGEFLYIVDSDDVMNIYAIDTMVKFQKKTNADIVTSNFCKISDDELNLDSKQKCKSNPKIEIITDNDYLCRKYLLTFKSNFTRTVWNKLLKMEIVKSLQGYPTVWDEKLIIGEDNFFLSKYLLKCKTACCINDELYFYRLRTSSLSHKHFDKKYYQIMKSSKHFLELDESVHPKTVNTARALQCDFAYWLLGKMWKSKYYDYVKIQWLYDEYLKNYPYFRKYFKWPKIASTFRNIRTKHIYKKLLSLSKNSKNN